MKTDETQAAPRPWSSQSAKSSAKWTCTAFCLWLALCPAAMPVRALTIDLLSPPSGSTNVSSPPNLTAHIYNTEATNLSITFYGRPSPSLVRPNFTIIALPDTQFYCASVNGGTPEIFNMQTDWVITNRVNRNIVFLTQLGDCVNNGEVESQWFNATNALYRLEDPLLTFLEHGIPYGICPGGHDLYWPYPEYRLYNKYFGYPRFADKPYYAGHYSTNNDNHYSLITASGLDLILLHLEWDAGQKTNVMAWANEVLQSNRQRRAIVFTHSLLDGNTAQFNAQGLPIYDALKANTNIFLMVCGHHPEAQRRMDVYNGSTIHTLLSDFTSHTNGGNGYLRIMEFSPSNSTLRVQTFSPFLNAFRVTTRNDFIIDGLNLSPVDDGYSPLFTVTNSPPGMASGLWNGLSAATKYDWYVAVDDGTNVTKSLPASFQTTPDYPGDNPPSPDAPYIFRTLRQWDGRITLLWRSIGGVRYRVEYKDSWGDNFSEIVRPPVEETDPAPSGVPSVQEFTDDFSLTGGPPVQGMRLYRVKRID